MKIYQENKEKIEDYLFIISMVSKLFLRRSVSTKLMEDLYERR